MLDPTVSKSLISADLSSHTKKYSQSVKSSNYVRKNTNDGYQLSDVVASNEYAHQYDGYTNVQKSLTDNLADLKTAQENFKTIKDNVAAIKSLVKSAKDGTISGTQLDDAQKKINDLVGTINSLVDSTTVGGKKVFDGNFTQKFGDDLSGGGLDVDFSRAGDVSRPLTLSGTMTPANDHMSTLRVLYADDKYIVGTAQFDANGETQTAGVTGTGRNGSVQIYDAKTKELIREIQSPMTDIESERFGYTVSVDGDNLLVGTFAGWVDNNGDNVNDSWKYDQNFSGGAFLYSISTGQLKTSFTKDSLAAINPLVNFGLRSENDYDSNPNTNNKMSNFGQAVKVQGNSVFVFKSGGDGVIDNRLGGQGSMSSSGILEFTLDGTFVKKYDATPNADGTAGVIQVSDDYIVMGDKGYTPGSSDYGYSSGVNYHKGRINIIDRNTGKIRYLMSDNPLVANGFGDTASLQGDKLLVGEPGDVVRAVYSGGVQTGWDTNRGYMTTTEWGQRVNNYDDGGFAGASYLYDINNIIDNYDSAYNAAKSAGKSEAQAVKEATQATSSTSSSSRVMTFDRDTLAAQGVDLDSFDAFGGGGVKLNGTTVVITARRDDVDLNNDGDTNDVVNGLGELDKGSTYVFDISKTYGTTGTGELVAKANGIRFAASSGVKLYESTSGTTMSEYDFSSVFGGPINSLAIDTTATRAATLGATSSRALQDITVSANVASLGGTKGLVDNQSLVDLGYMEDNLTKQEATLGAMVKRASNALNRLGTRMDILKGRKDSVDKNLKNYFNEPNISTQEAKRRKALDLLP